MSSTRYPATAMPDTDWWEALWPNPADVVARLGVRPEWNAIDLCCGDGLFTLPLAQVARRVIAIDIDPVMLHRTEDKLSRSGMTNYELIEADAGSLQALVQPQSADMVLVASTFHGVPDKPQLARHIATVLRSGGRFVVINWHRQSREQTTVLGQPRGPKTEMRMEPSDVAAVVQPVGFEPVSVIELPPYYYAAIFEKDAQPASSA